MLKKIFQNLMVVLLFFTFNPVVAKAALSKTPAANCISGMAGSYPCHQIQLLSAVDLNTSGVAAKGGNDIWGWTDPITGHEYALMGMTSKTSIVDVTNPNDPVHVADIPSHRGTSIWRDIKVYQDHAFIVSEAWRHGMQVVDLNRLREINQSPAILEEDAHYSLFGSAHNIAINEDSGTAFAVGTDTCDAGMHMIDIRNPKEPKFLTCVDKTIFEPMPPSNPRSLHGEDYTHDVQCVMYHGPDAKYQGKEICVASNADTVNIVDVTNKAAPAQISVKDYDGLGYTHQGWLTEDHQYFLLGDELDEMQFHHNTKTLIWDVRNLENPIYIGAYIGETKAIDHNMYIKGHYAFQANYDSGLRILDISDIANANLREVAYFDTEPASNKSEFLGAWSVYPYFKSGNIIISNIDGQLFVVHPTL